PGGCSITIFFARSTHYFNYCRYEPSRTACRNDNTCSISTACRAMGGTCGSIASRVRMEETSMFSFPIIDTHVHLWDSTYLHRPWLEEVPLLNRPYSLEQYLEQTVGLSIEAIVCVEADVLPEERLQEVRWLSDQAHQNSLIQGIVAAAPIGIEDRTVLRSYLEKLVTIDPRVKGV